MGLVFKMYANESDGELYPDMDKWDSSCAPDGQFSVMVDGQQVYPEYLTDVKVLVCPSDSDYQGDLENLAPGGVVNNCGWYSWSYLYLPWLLSDQILMSSPSADPNDTGITVDTVLTSYTNADIVNAFLPGGHWTDGIADWVNNGNDGVFTSDFTEGSTTGLRLREGIERFLISDINNPAASAKAQSEIFIMWDDVNAADAGIFNHVPGGGNVLYMDGHVEFLKYPSDSPVSRFACSFWGAALTII
jgi:prepilin-type processing-associated H-X9-DG protein